MSFTQSNWNSCYLDGRTAWRDHHRDYADWLELMSIQTGTVLDLGCGTGEKAIWFQQHGFEVEALDYSSEALKIAKDQSKFDCFHQWDLEQLNQYPTLHAAYDIILDIKVLAFIKDKQRYLDTITKLLRGFLVLEVIWEHDEHPHVVINKSEFEELIKGTLQIVHHVPLPSRSRVKMEILFLQSVKKFIDQSK